MEKIKLKPCPFCGRKPEHIKTVAGWNIMCFDSCGLIFNPENCSKKEVSKRWNKRVKA